MRAAQRDARFAGVRAIVEAEQAGAPGPRAARMAEAIRARHGHAVKAFIFYGSGLRDEAVPDRMLDFYVLVDRYRSVHGAGLKALASFLLPPSVHFLAAGDGADGGITSKYSVVSLPAFLRRASGKAREPMVWARFSQPCLIMACDRPETRDALIDALASGILHFAGETQPLLREPFSSRDFWTRALCESYRTELRAERPRERAREIVERYGARYDALGAAVFGPPGADGKIRLPASSGPERLAAQASWALRRWTGKPATALRVLKAAFTFDGGLDYVLHKLERHSGVGIEVTEHQRRHPLLWSPVLAWRLWRRGAFR